MKKIELTKDEFYNLYHESQFYDGKTFALFYKSLIDMEKTAAMLIAEYKLRQLNIGNIVLKDMRYKTIK